MSTFSKALLHWYDVHKRDLPWKHDNDAYGIWLSEIILQQTRVNQGLPYYLKFKSTYPNVHELANADVDEVLKLWEGLGYYSRARNLHTTAKTVAHQYNGYFPETYEDLIKLKGIGSYTASAILSFAFHKAYPAIDGNAYRVVSRFLGLTSAIDLPETKKVVEKWLFKQIDKTNPGNFNQAMMDLGSMVCMPKNPLCLSCPLHSYCVAHQNDLVKTIPFKAKKIVKKERYFYFLMLLDEQKNTLIQKRNGKDIWLGLHQFPLLELKKNEKITKQKIEKFVKQNLNLELTALIPNKPVVYTHQLTHQKIFAKFYILETKSLKNKRFPQDINLVNLENITTFAFPKLIQTYLHNFLNKA